jgi:hypothetical protein
MSQVVTSSIAISWVALLYLGACSASNEDSGIQELDLTRTYRAAPDGGEQWLVPDMSIEPFSEEIFCYYGSHQRETVGVNYLQPFMSSHNHHAFIQATDQKDRPDGTLERCTSVGSMEQTSPLFEFTGSSFTSDGNYLALPENSAIKLNQGQQWVIEAHFINPTPDRIIVNAAFNLGFVPVETVERWTASWQFDIGDLLVPAGQEATLQFECGFPMEVSLLTLAGHMHEFGRKIVIDLIQGEENTKIYAVEEWTPEYRDYPPLSSWEPDELLLTPDDSLSISCTWKNNEEEALSFPQEMCTAKGLVLDTEDAIFCVNGNQMGQGESE